MTDEQVIDRLTSAMDKLLIDYPYGGDLSGHQIATAAWQEVKALMMESAADDMPKHAEFLRGLAHDARRNLPTGL